MTCAQMICLLAMGSLIGFAFHPNLTSARAIAMTILGVALSAAVVLLEMAR